MVESDLQRHNVTTKMLEAVRDHSRTDEGLESHVANTHVLVASLLGIGTVVLLDHNSTLSHLLESVGGL